NDLGIDALIAPLLDRGAVGRRRIERLDAAVRAFRREALFALRQQVPPNVQSRHDTPRALRLTAVGFGFLLDIERIHHIGKGPDLHHDGRLLALADLFFLDLDLERAPRTGLEKR